MMVSGHELLTSVTDTIEQFLLNLSLQKFFTHGVSTGKERIATRVINGINVTMIK